MKTKSKTLSNSDVNKFIRENWDKYTHAKLGEILGITEGAVRGRGKRMKLPDRRQKIWEMKLDPEKQVEVDKVRIREKTNENQTNRKYKILIKEVEDLRAQLEATKTVKDINSFSIKGNRNDVGDATAFIIASDWHYWETVNADQVDNLNEFNKEIAHRRALRFFENSVRLIKREQRDSKITTVVLALLGDFISNNIHPELMESNQGLPIDELMAVQDVLVSGIKYILENTDVNLIIPCHSGNHGRATEKKRVSTEAGNSFEYLMYHNIASYFRDEDRLKFMISRGYLSYLDVSGFVVRFHHGHNLKFAGGIGGIFIPAFKAISQWDKGRRADLDVFGHFHQMKDGGKFISNGSLVGYNDYALSIKADYEKPKQVFFIINHNKKEKTTTCPIFLE